MERDDTSATAAQSLSLETHEVYEARGALRPTRAPGAIGRSLSVRVAAAQRPLAVVLLLQLAVSVVLVALMAARSPINAHPDETLHLDAGRYFVDHWLPPPVGAPDAAAAYSKYGRSYVDEGDIVYWLFGAAAALGESLGLASPFAMRWFQVSLYCGLAAWTIVRARQFAPAWAFLVLTPQVWYVFSYINGDALPFALLTVLLMELSWPDSPVRAFLSGADARPTAGVFVVGGLLGLLALSKLNYMIGVLFVVGVLAWLGYETRHWKRAALLVVIAAVVASPWMTYHGWVNDFRTGEKIFEHAEKVAAPEMKPSAQTGPNSFRYMALRAKGVPLWDVLTTLNWVGLSFRSFCGLYGWMSIVAVPWFYRVFAVLYVVLLAILILPVVVRGSRRTRSLLIGVGVCAALVLTQSVYRSWVYDFQGQGRYLFPILPMLFFFWRQCEAPALRVAALFVSALVGTDALLSFALIGLGSLARHA
ncbi:MAG TPA: DUF2142 domain-containing protein [Candidatus Binatia bacterium]|nr:DUF2142 domain-containing protein [Candidatus Binatia bacterium]